jgi:aromatic-L-amino-acid decarboxylase
MMEEHLDPENWESFRQLAHTMVDDVLDYLKNVGTQAVWTPMPDSSRKYLEQEIPLDGSSPEEVYEAFKTHIFPYNKGNVHPRFWAWVQGTGTPMGVFADMLASAMNPNVTIGEHAAMYVDQQVVNWCKSMMGYPEDSSGMLVSGGSMANTTALTVARNTMLLNSRNIGLQQYEKQPVMYCSAESHSCIIKAAEMTGIGKDGLRKIDVDASFKIIPEKLEEAIHDDLDAGLMPFCVVANCGTVNTGAIDDLKAIYEICEKYGLWFHIDGAFGLLAMLTDEYKELLAPASLADSLAFDLHKWMYMPYDVGCVLIRNKAKHRNAFSITPNYLLQQERGLASGPESLNNYGIELSRSFKALKVWMSLKEHGIRKYSRMIAQNIQQARYLADIVDQAESLERLAEVPLNIVCFRYRGAVTDENELHQINLELLMQLQEKGIASPSSTILNGRFVIRVAITNQRTEKGDLDVFVKSCVQLGDSIVLLNKDIA